MARHGRFLEIGRYDMAMNSSLGMASLAKNISFHAIFLDQLMHDDDYSHPDWPIVSDMLQQGIKSGVVQPLSSTVFDSDRAEDAFRYMAAGKHIGKVLVSVRPEEEGVSGALALDDRIPRTVNAVQRTICHPLHVYLITGGLGGFGLELANWLFMHGAKKIVLSSRSGVKTNYQRRYLSDWKRKQLEVRISTQPIGTEEGCAKLIAECLEMGPAIGGVFHLALVLRDLLFEDQTADNFKDAAVAKYWGTRNLDKITRRECPKLKWFVVFSSVTASRGNGGQTNYGWANSTMERVVCQRRADGHAGIAIQWGGIGDVGVIVDAMGGDNHTLITGTYPQRITSCLKSLDQLLCWNHAVVSSYIRADIGDGKGGNKGKRGSLIQSICRIMGVSDESQIDKEASLSDMGLDSLMGVEIKQVLERDYEIFLSAKDIRTLTLAKLEIMAESDGLIALDETAGQTSDPTEAVASELQSIMEQQFQLRLDMTDVVQLYERIIPLNQGKTGKPVIFLHSIEGVATAGVRELSEKLPFPVFCIQWNPSVNTDTMDTIADDYIQVLKNNIPSGPYRIVGYSYGASVAIAMATKLQESDGVDTVEKLVLLDGSHAYMRAYRNAYRKLLGDGLLGSSLLESKYFDAHILCTFIGRMGIQVSQLQLRKELLEKSDWEERLSHVVDFLEQRQTSETSSVHKNVIRHALDGIRSRLICADSYDPKTKFQGNAWLIRSDQEVQSVEVAKDYGLSDIMTGDVSVMFVEGTHDEIVQGASSAKTAQILAGIMSD